MRKAAVVGQGEISAKELKASNEELQKALHEANRQRNEFLAALAHELRNPLAPICSGLELMRTAPNQEELDYARKIIERQVALLVCMVDDLRDISHIAQGKIHLKKKRMDLLDGIRSVLEDSRPFLESRKHQLTVMLPDGPIYLDADSLRISQVLQNLLNHAARNTQPGGRISLATQREGEQAVVRVKDSGIGISAEMVPRTFDILALGLVKDLVEMHGGSVDAFSEGAGRGSEFVVRLPLAAGQKSSVQVSPRLPGGKIPQRQSRILIVDDNVDVGDTLRALLIEDRHTVEVVRDGEAALQTAAEFRPEIVLLDIGLPGMDGYEVAKALRERSPGMFLIALSGWGQTEDRLKSKKAGFDHHLVKPTGIATIRDLLASISDGSARS